MNTSVCHGISAGKAFCMVSFAVGENQPECRPVTSFYFCLVKKELKKAEESGKGICFAKEGDDNRISCKDISSFQVTKS